MPAWRCPLGVSRALIACKGLVWRVWRPQNLNRVQGILDALSRQARRFRERWGLRYTLPYCSGSQPRTCWLPSKEKEQKKHCKHNLKNSAVCFAYIRSMVPWRASELPHTLVRARCTRSLNPCAKHPEKAARWDSTGMRPRDSASRTLEP